MLTLQNIQCSADGDRVQLSISSLHAAIPYATSFKIAQALRLAAKDAMRYAKEDVGNWRDMAAVDEVKQHTSVVKATLVNNSQWATGWNGENVKLKLGDVIVQFHFTIALQLSEWLRKTGKEAKLWAGDTSKSISIAGVLSDAEMNYKLGVR